ncbi:MAG: hypothetical protein IJ391_02885 [Clostridia bacterium]|nr:hypothetical protein [Clostridia bacterium]
MISAYIQGDKKRKKIDHDFDNITCLCNYIRKRYSNEYTRRITIYSDDMDGIANIVESFMPSEYMNKVNSITAIRLELTIDLLPIIAEIEGDDYHYYDFHSDCMDLEKGDIIFNLKDNTYYLISLDPAIYTISYACKNAHDCQPTGMLSRLDIRKASEKEIKLYGLDKLRDIYNTSTSYEDFHKRLADLRNEYPRLV